MRIMIVVVAIVALRSIASAQLSAEELYAQGEAAYSDRDYRTAATLWARAYGLSHEPLLIFNTGQALRLAGDCAGALAAYRRFIAIDPSSEQRPLADEFVSELHLKCGAAAPTTTTTPPVVGPAPAWSGRTFRIAGLAIGGTGALSITVGLVLGHRAARLEEEVTRACSISCDWTELKSKDAAGRRAATTGYALDVLGAAAIVGGGIMYLVGHQRSAITVAPRPRDSGAVVTWSGVW